MGLIPAEAQQSGTRAATSLTGSAATHLDAERVKNLIFLAPSKFRLFKPFKLFTFMGYIVGVTQPDNGTPCP
jgi:hypothetical protein